MPDINWISRQKTFFKEPHEFKQIQRIKDFFNTTKNAPTMLLGDTSYFDAYFNNKVTTAPEQVLFVCNTATSLNEFKKQLQSIKATRICIAVNKFRLYSTQNSNTVNSNYDISLFDFVQDIFKDSRIDYFYEKDLGDKFNFASPTTQFYITHD